MGPSGYSPQRTRGGGGGGELDEYASVIENVSLPAAQATRSFLTPAVLVAVGAVAAALAWYDFH